MAAIRAGRSVLGLALATGLSAFGGGGPVAACPADHREVFAWAPAVAEVGRSATEVIAGLGGRVAIGLEANASIVALGGDVPAALAVRYPAGSINPGNRVAPLGGAQFFLPVPAAAAASAACLRYRVKFPEGFRFGRGGKLPGLYGSAGSAVSAASGCRPVDDASGFTVRLMWRRDGDGEVYAYVQNKDRPCGLAIGRGRWRFPVGRWVTVELEIVLGPPAADGGSVRLWIDGVNVVDHRGLRYRSGEAVQIGGLFFSSFFGGRDRSWASPVDQEAQFADFRLFVPPE
jgi:hypothetical protein